MTVMSIKKMGDPLLARQAKRVDLHSEQLIADVSNMIDTMRYYQGVGLAAPQIGLSKRIIIVEVDHNIRYPRASRIELNVLINPQIINFSAQKQSDWEGCLSLPELRGKVTRSCHITYRAKTLDGDTIVNSVNGFYARIIQHEIDHLDGVLYPQRMDDCSAFGYEDSLPAY